MVRWIKVKVQSFWNPNRFIPHSGLFEGLLGEDRVLLHSWAEGLPKGLAFCTKNIDKVDLSKIPQRHLFVREQYMFWSHEEEQWVNNMLSEINIDGICRFLEGCEIVDKIVYLPFFINTHLGIEEPTMWSEFQDFVCSRFEHEFYFDYNEHSLTDSIKIISRQISLDDLV